MKRFTVGLLAALLLGGCRDSARETKTWDDKSPATSSAAASDTSAGRSEGADDTFDAADAVVPVDAESLLAATFAAAKMEDKRVMVHLGAPW